MGAVGGVDDRQAQVAGAAGTWFWVDPKNDLLFVGMIQLLSEAAPPLQAMTQKRLADAILN